MPMQPDPNALAALEAFGAPPPGGGAPPQEAVICQVCGSAINPGDGAPVM